MRRWTLLFFLAAVLTNSDAVAQQRCEVGSFAAATSTFYRDANGNGAWDGATGGDSESRLYALLGTGLPLVGDWNGDGFDDIGKQVGTVFVLDLDGDGVWEGAAGGDRAAHFAAAFGAGTPITGDWDGDGDAEIGTFIAAEKRFLLDRNGTGRWDGNAGGDRNLLFAPTLVSASTPVAPLIGDWNDDGSDDVGWSDDRGTAFQDLDGDGSWDGFPVDLVSTYAGRTDATFAVRRADGADSITRWIAAVSAFTSPLDPGTWVPQRFAAFKGGGVPLLCDWNGDGSDENAKVVRGTHFLLDRDGIFQWRGDAAGDQTAIFDVGVPAMPIAGRWMQP